MGARPYAVVGTGEQVYHRVLPLMAGEPEAMTDQQG